MSRSNPTQNAPNPANRFYEWNGEKGCLRYYDKSKKANVDVPAKFTFLVLDQLSTIRGWHERSKSGIYANEVRDTKADVLVVKAHKGGVLCEGLYSTIKDRAVACGGKFTCSMWLAYREGKGPLEIGVMQLHGASLNAWIEFRKANRTAIYEQAVKVDGAVSGKKGNIKFKTPVFVLADLSPDSNEQAKKLDVTVQEFLKAYLAKTVSARADANVQDDAQESEQEAPPDDDQPPADSEDAPPENDDNENAPF